MHPLLTQWRLDTPAAEAGRIHLNNAGAALMPTPVLKAVEEHLKREMMMGGYEAADAAASEIEAAYVAVAGLIGAQPRNVAIVENATVAIAQALSAFDFAPGDVILTTRCDYVSNQLMYLSLAKRCGVRVVRADDRSEGGVDPESVRTLIGQHRPKVVVLTWVPTNSGLVQDAAAVGAVCAELDVPYIVDACQAVGQLPIDVRQLHCDFLGATARKFLRGPRGIGFLYVSDRVLQSERAPLYIDMQGARWLDTDVYELVRDAHRFENWEFAYALVLGLGEAARYAQHVGIATIVPIVQELAAKLRAKLTALDHVRVLDRGREQCAIVTAEIAGHDARDVVSRLREEAINVSATLREYAVLDMDEKHVQTAVRLSPHYYNTPGEINIAVSALEEFAPR
ncbi:MAG TPA: aminotransferase class V-fold PLP-dependent enzyme [Longimicrobiales bacterium]|nr:aminotransferase class V-fold PLP-dependent enzyme [Longimicrobiales bacterium]